MEIKVAKLSDEIEAFEHLRDKLEADCLGKWVVVHDRKLVGTFDSFETAANQAVRQFGRGPYLIRQVGAVPVVLPASAMYHIPRG